MWLDRMRMLPNWFDLSPSGSSIFTRSIRKHITQLRRHETIAPAGFETHAERLMNYVHAQGYSDAIPDDNYIMSDTLDHISAGKRFAFIQSGPWTNQARHFDHSRCPLRCCVSPLTPETHRSPAETARRVGSIRNHICCNAFIRSGQAGCIPRVRDSGDFTTQPSSQWIH